jgi:SAM-dependent methyltransferase
MIDRPAVLAPEVARSFQYGSVVAAYRHRPPYPAAVFDRLLGLLGAGPRTALDLGCGTGAVALPLAARGLRVDAVDVSAAMIAAARRQPGGDHPGVTWIVGRAEDAPLRPPYALVTAGHSLHWLEWEVALPRLADVLTPDGVLAVLSVAPTWPAGALPWGRELEALLRRYTTVKEWTPAFDLIAELERRGLFRALGRATTAPELFVQSVDEYVESWHSTATLARERMGGDAAAAFDAALRQLVVERIGDTIRWDLTASILWGKPLRP